MRSHMIYDIVANCINTEVQSYNICEATVMFVLRLIAPEVRRFGEDAVWSRRLLELFGELCRGNKTSNFVRLRKD